MNIKFISCFIFSLFLFSSASALLDQNFTNVYIDVTADIPATEDWAGIELNTTSIDFGAFNLSEGSNNLSVRTKYKIRSQGNVNITVTPYLEDETDKIFKYLEFARTYSSGWKKIGNYSILMSRTYSAGEWTPSSWLEQSIQLNLKNYVEERGRIPFDIPNHRNRILFEVTPRYD